MRTTILVAVLLPLAGCDVPADRFVRALQAQCLAGNTNACAALPAQEAEAQSERDDRAARLQAISAALAATGQAMQAAQPQRPAPSGITCVRTTYTENCTTY
jgi:hypothetical protein